MKRKIFTKIISLVLVLTLMFSLCATTIGATTAGNNDGKSVTNSNDDKKLYVSLGDSMTNGFGLEGYEPDGENYFGFLVESENSYPAMVAGQMGWEHVNLATSGLRADDIYYLLNYGTENAVEWDEYGTTYIYDKFRHAYGVYELGMTWAEADAKIQKATHYDKVIAYAAETYQQYVKDADVISVNVGSNNFATLIHLRISYLLEQLTGNTDMFGGYKGEFDFNELVGTLKPEQKVEIEKLYNELSKELFAYAAEAGIDTELVLNPTTGITMGYILEDLAHAFAYTTAGFVVGYAGIMETINRVNPTAEVIVVELANWFAGRVVELPLGDKLFTIPAGEVFDTVYDFANAYMAAVAAQYSVGAVVEKTPDQLRENIDTVTAQISKLIASYDAQIVDLKAKLNNASGEAKVYIERAIADVKADLADALDALIKISTPEDFDSTAALKDLSAQIGNALASAGSVAYDNLDAYIDAEIKSMHAATNVAIEGLMSAAATGTAALSALLVKVTEAEAKEAAAKIAEISADLAVAIAGINEKLAADIAAVEANVNYNVENAKAYIIGLEAEAEAQIAALEAEAAAQIAIIQATLKLMTEDGKVQYAIAKTVLENKIAALKEQANDQIATLKVQIGVADLAMKAEVEKAIAAEYAALAADIAAAEAEYEAVMLDLYAQEQELEAYVFAEIAKIEAELDAALVKAAEKLEVAVNVLLGYAATELDELEETICAEIDKEIKALEQKIDDLDKELKDTVSALEKELADIENKYEDGVAKLPTQKIYFAEVDNVELIVDEIASKSYIDLDELYAIEDDKARYDAALEYVTNLQPAKVIPAGPVRNRLLRDIGSMVIEKNGYKTPDMTDIEAFDKFMYDTFTYVCNGSMGPAGYELSGWDGLTAYYAEKYGAAAYDYIGGSILFLGLEKSLTASLSAKSSDLRDLVIVADMSDLMNVTMKSLSAEYCNLSDLNSIAAALLANEKLSVVSNMLFSFMAGDGAILHPSVAGHETIAAAIVEAYKSEHTAIDETVENLKIAAGILAGFVAEYYDEAYADAYKKLDEEGYITKLVDALHDIKSDVEKLEAELNSEDFDEEYRHLISLLDAELYNVADDIDALIELVLEADELDEATYAKARELYENLLRHLDSADDIMAALEVIADDHTAKLIADLKVLYADVLAKAEIVAGEIENCIAKHCAYVIAFYLELIDTYPEYYNSFVEALVDSIATHSHEAAKELYYWLYNNPETVIEFFINNGDDIVAFFAENGRYIVAVLTYLANHFGDDVLNLVLDNADVILPALAEWYAIHGDLVWDLVGVYVKTILQYTDLDDRTIEKITEIFDEIIQILDDIISGKLAHEALAEALKKLENAIAKLVAYINGVVSEQIDALKALVWDYLLGINNEILERIAEFEAAIMAALKNASEAVKAHVLAELNTLKAMLLNIRDYTIEQLEIQLARLAEALKVAALEAGEYVYAEFEKIFEYASKVGVTPEEDPYYVAVNGGYAGYAELVADALGLSNFDVTTWDDLDYEALAKAGLITVGFDENELSAFAISQLLAYINDYLDEDVRNSVNDYADVVLATLIESLPPYVKPEAVLGDLDFSTPINGAIDEIVGFYLIADRDVAEMDWAALVGEQNVGYVDAVRAELKKQLVATGVMETFEYKINVVDIIFDNKDSFAGEYDSLFAMFDKDGFKEVLGENQYYTLEIPVVDTLLFAAESYLYGFVEFSVEYANLVEYIMVNNPEAAVVLLSAYNAFDMDFDLLGYSVNLGSAYDYVAKLASAQPKAYALVASNVGYADISGAQTLYNEYVELEIFSNSIEEFLVWYLLDNTLTDVSEAGNYYIYEQIMNALVILEPVAHEHVYDNSCDCYCNICGEYREVEHVYDNDCDRYCNVCNEYRITKHVYDNDCDAICNECGAARVPADHVYDNACDADCNACGDVREVSPHAYDNACDADCNVCGAIRVPGVHKYDNACDADCNVCGATRVPADHVYDNDCDADCNVCGATRTPAEHVYDNACDKDCNVCGDTRTTSHKYDNDCDKTCNVCGATRTPGEHKYDNACDKDCNVCGATRPVADHVDANNDGKCDACGAEVPVKKTEEQKDGLGAGAIVAIILGSTVGASAAGGSVFWFVIKKKSFADLLNLVKGLAK